MMMPPPEPAAGMSLTLVEFCLTLISACIAFVLPGLGGRFFASIERAFTSLARRRRLSIAVVFAAEIVLRVAMLPTIGIPRPFVPDDFSFLLAAQTFSLGRLTNPTPAMWRFFETMHVSMTPTYMSMYFPAQGLMLAAGRLVLGHYWWGMLVTMALLCAAICWMLQAWLPPRWALFGGLLAVLHLGLFTYWINTYHAASIVALGGALVLGALPRLMRHLRLRDALLLACGVILLATTRPYEGLLLCGPVALVLLRWLLFSPRRPAPALVLRRAALPVALMIAAASWMAYYDARVFGNALTLPYSVNRVQYAVSPYFVWQQQRPDPGYRHAVMREFYYDREAPMYRKIHNPATFLPATAGKFLMGLLFFAGFALLLPLLMVRRLFLDRRTRFLLVGVLILIAGVGIEIYLIPHYLAPFTAAFYALGLQMTRHLRVWRPSGKPVGLTMVRLMMVVVVCMCGLRLFAEPLHFKIDDAPAGGWNLNWYGPAGHFGPERAAIEADLERLPGRQLAIVRYAPQHEPLYEWVYNSPDIDNAKVVWAREMSPQENKDLMQYYRDRKVWLIEPDATPARVVPYPESPAP